MEPFIYLPTILNLTFVKPIRYIVIYFFEVNYSFIKTLCQADYKHWLIEQLGLPPLEDWRDNMLLECFKNFIEMKEMYRDEWDDNYWDAIIQSGSAAS